MMPRFRYSLTIRGEAKVFNPLNTAAGYLRSEKEGENIFHRRKLSGSLTFEKEDFTRLYEIETSPERCEEIYLNLERHCGRAYVPEWQGKFGLNDVDWNLDQCKATVSPKPNDAYQQLMENYTKEHNILKVPASVNVSAKLDFEGQFEFKNITGDTLFDLEDADTWAVFLQSRYFIDGTIIKGGVRNKVDILFRLITYRDKVAGKVVELDGWSVVDEEETRVKYAKAPDLYNFTPYRYGGQKDFTKYPDLIQIPCGQAYDTSRYINVSAAGQATSNACGNSCLNFRRLVTQDRCVTLLWEFGKFYFDRNRKLLSVINYLLQQTAPAVAPLEVTDISEFFTSETNYVTNEPNPLIDILIAQKSDILSWNSSEAATKGMLSLKNLLEELRSLFDVHWFINAAGKFQIEHRSYFQTLGTVDLLQQKYAVNLNGKRAYEYMTDKMPRYEKLTFANYLNEDFYQGIIEYSGACVNKEEGQDTDEKNITRITTDIEHLVTASGSDKNGFVLLTHAGGGLLKEAGAITGQPLVNGHLAAANLVKTYWTYNRVLFSGLVNNVPTAFKSIKKTIKQVELSVPSCCGDEFGAFHEYITNLGEKGELLSSELSLKTETIKLSIAFDKVIKQTFPHPDDPQDPDNPTVPLPPTTTGRQFTDQFSKQFA